VSRFQISINVRDAEEAVVFYTKLFGVGPAKHRPGYANFVVANPPMKFIVIENEGEPGTINHVGIEVSSTDDVAAEAMRLEGLGLPLKVEGTHTCCFATQDKVWTMDPEGIPWEVYTVLEDTENFGARAH
jgi:catechol 2,3-dioxygenase-like lactoylglutathione lyase family enzyme